MTKITKIKCNQCGGEYNILGKIEYNDGGNYDNARMKHINTKRHQRYVEERYNANPIFWDKVYRENIKKINEMNK